MNQKLIPCPTLYMKKRKNQSLEDLLDAWEKKAIKEKGMFSSKAKKAKREVLRKQGRLKNKGESGK